MDKTTRINFCKAFAEKVAGKQGIENKSRYLLEDFFYEKDGCQKLIQRQIQRQ